MKEKITRRETGMVTSSSRDKTITVLIERIVKHPRYKKILKRSTKLHAHDENNECQQGDLVRIEECSPISKTKSWKLFSVEKRSQKID